MGELCDDSERRTDQASQLISQLSETIIHLSKEVASQQTEICDLRNALVKQPPPPAPKDSQKPPGKGKEKISFTDAAKIPSPPIKPKNYTPKQSPPKKEPLFKPEYTKINREIGMEHVHKPLNPVNMDIVMDAVNRQLLPHDTYLLFAKKTSKNNYVLYT